MNSSSASSSASDSHSKITISVEKDGSIPVARVSGELKQRGLIFVGLDVIGDKLTEINVTSPTCVREIEAQFDVDIGGRLMAAIDARL